MARPLGGTTPVDTTHRYSRYWLVLYATGLDGVAPGKVSIGLLPTSAYGNGYAEGPSYVGPSGYHGVTQINQEITDRRFSRKDVQVTLMAAGKGADTAHVFWHDSCQNRT